MVENLNVQKVLAPVSLTSRVKKARREKNKNRQKSFDEELKEKKEKRNGRSIDKQKTDKRKEVSLNDKHNKDTDAVESKQGKLIDLHI